MKLSKNMKKTLISEIRFATKHMRESNEATSKLFFMSAVHGMAHRIMNLEFDPELVFLHDVLSHAYNTINGNMAIPGPQRVNEKIFVQLENSFDQLATAIEEDKRTYEVLETISNLAYATTGNGFYNCIKGNLKIYNL